jgi:hypothetical protein
VWCRVVFRDEFVRMVSAEGEKRSETGYCGYVRCTCAASDCRNYIDLGT